MTKRVWRILVVLVGFIVVVLVQPLPFPLDVNLNTPESVAKNFVEAVRLRDYGRASTYWEPQSLINVEHNAGMPFAVFCDTFFAASDYTLKWSAVGKNGAYRIGYSGEVAGTKKSYALYLKRYSGRWLIIEDRIGGDRSK